MKINDIPKPVAINDPVLLCLTQAGLIDAAMVEKITLAAQQANISSLNYLSTQKDFDMKKIAQAIANYLGLPYFDLKSDPPINIPTDILDPNFIQQNRVLPFYTDQMKLHLAISEISHSDIISEIKFYTDLSIHPVVTEANKLSQLVDNYLYNQRIQELKDFHTSSQIGITDDKRLINFLQNIICDAIHKNASDIHFEPYKNIYRIRTRIDGILHKTLQIPNSLANRITARLKVMARLNSAERRLPQDGRFTIEITPHIIKDCRINICPTLFGEKSVIRILDSGKKSLNIEELGLDTVQIQMFNKAIEKQQGMILVTGPTGSGKTISLYSALNILNTSDKNISTVEEPVEIQLPGINQINVQPTINLTFTTILRALLRQDPDVIMIGEIRDLETAEIAIKASQTGHLVISTLHTNSAAETLIRLAMMGVSIFNIAHAIHLIIAQRLLRKLCERCKKIQSPLNNKVSISSCIDSEIADWIIYQAVGCDYCTKGYSGRIGIFEFLPISPQIIRLILKNALAQEIAQENERSGMKNLLNSALAHVKAGITTLEEVYRVIL